MNRRKFLHWLGRSLGLMTLGGIVWRVMTTKRPEAEFIQPSHRYGWQIDPEKCRFCSLCETACVRKPSAVKAVNDQKKCSYCVVCYGHISDRQIASNQINSHGQRICPYDAVERKRFSGGIEGYYLYTVDSKRCTGCGRCVSECNRHGSRSMFLIIRPDLCLGCNDCSIAKVCPQQAVERVPMGAVDDFRGYYIPQDHDTGS